MYSLSTESHFKSYFWGQSQNWKILVSWKGHLNLPTYQMLLWVLIQVGVSHFYIVKEGYFQRSDEQFLQLFYQLSDLQHFT